MKRKFTKSPIWLLFGLGPNGLQLFSVDTEEWIARRHLDMLKHAVAWGTSPFKNLVRVWIEKGETNHLCAVSMIDKDVLSVMFTLEEMEFLGYDPEFIETIRKFRAEKRAESSVLEENQIKHIQ